jgi:hypothetical protein
MPASYAGRAWRETLTRPGKPAVRTRRRLGERFLRMRGNVFQQSHFDRGHFTPYTAYSHDSSFDGTRRESGLCSQRIPGLPRLPPA